MYTIESVVSDLIQMKEKIKTCTIKSGITNVLLSNEYANIRTNSEILISCGFHKTEFGLSFKKEEEHIHYFFFFDTNKVLYHNTAYHDIIYSLSFGNAKRTSIVVNKKQKYENVTCEVISDYIPCDVFSFYKNFYYSHIGI